MGENELTVFSTVFFFFFFFFFFQTVNERFRLIIKNKITTGQQILYVWATFYEQEKNFLQSVNNFLFLITKIIPPNVKSFLVASHEKDTSDFPSRELFWVRMPGPLAMPHV